MSGVSDGGVTHFLVQIGASLIDPEFFTLPTRLNIGLRSLKAKNQKYVGVCKKEPDFDTAGGTPYPRPHVKGPFVKAEFCRHRHVLP